MIGRRKKRHDLPTRVYMNRGWYWWVEPGTEKWHKLGKAWDLAAKLRWAELSGREVSQAMTNTVATMLDGYLNDPKTVARLSARTVADSTQHAIELGRIFGQMAPGDVSSQHVAQYLEMRVDRTGKPAPVRANREISTLSSAYSWAMRRGLAAMNPCYGVRRNPESPSRRAPELWEIRAVQKHTTPKWAAVIELALLLGQRGVDLRTLRRNAVTEDGILIEQTKRGAKVLIEWSPELRAAHDNLVAITSRYRTQSMYLVPAKLGQPYTASGWKAMMYKAVSAALEAGDIEERFSFHTIRAASATIEDEQGGKPQKRLGHRTENQTATYIRGRRPTRVKPLKVS